MADNMKELGEEEGFRQGWIDALKGLPRFPRPEVGLGLFDAGYQKSFNEQYLDGYETGVEERKRADALKLRRLQERQNQNER